MLPLPERGNALGKEATRTIFQEFTELMFDLSGGRGGAELCCPCKEFLPKPSVLRGQEMLGVPILTCQRVQRSAT